MGCRLRLHPLWLRQPVPDLPLHGVKPGGQNYEFQMENYDF